MQPTGGKLARGVRRRHLAAEISALLVLVTGSAGCHAPAEAHGLQDEDVRVAHIEIQGPG